MPTDERYLKLSDTQVALLVANWLDSYDEQVLKNVYWKNKEGCAAKDAPSDVDLAALGYSPEDIEKIKAELR